jgi:hypothetical protein
MSFNIGNITLGGTDLNNSLQWIDRWEHSPVAQEVKRTLGGGLVVFVQSLQVGRPVTLVATADTGWFTYEMVTAIQGMAAQPTTVFVFEYGAETYNVRFNHADAPAVSFQPLTPKTTYNNTTDYFIGTVKLFTV